MGNKQEKEAAAKFQEQTNIGNVPAKTVEAVFRRFAAHEAGGQPTLNHRLFDDALEALEKDGLKKISHTPLSRQLFRVFDRDNSGSIDLNEFITGITLLSNGTLDDKAEVTFKAFDTNKNGYIEESELVEMVSASYDAAVKVALSLSDLSKMDELTSSVVSMVRTQMEGLARDMMQKLDTNHDGRLDLEEFKTFCRNVDDIKATVNGLGGKVNIIA
eukprot:m51a1_g6558 hypothetical protein (216) ;mRNA; f:112275-113400